MVNTALYTDQYELTALGAALQSGVASRKAVFEVFARSLPSGRRYGIFCGFGRVVDALRDFAFDAETIDFLARSGVAGPDLAAYLTDWRFTGSIHAYREGETYFAYSPVVRVEAPFAEACIIETLLLSILNHDTAIASAASRMVSAARGRPLVEMGTRRTHEEAALAAARAAYIAGFVGTSNLAAGKRYGIPTIGTAMHAFTLAHESELDAFRAQIATLGVGTTLLVDTYDIDQGIRNAVSAATGAGAAGPGAIRIDSGDLCVEAKKARLLLDSLGATKTKVTVTSDLDEFAIDALATSPVDSYGVGTKLVSGSGAPTAGFVYKLVAITDGAGELRPVAKRSAFKESVGGRKFPYRVLRDQVAVAERFSLSEAIPGNARPLHHTVMLEGEVTAATPLGCISDHRARALAELPPGALSVAPGEPVFTATLAEDDTCVTVAA